MKYTQNSLLLQIGKQPCSCFQILHFYVIHMSVVCSILRYIWLFNQPSFGKGSQIFIIIVPDCQPFFINSLCFLKLSPQISRIHITGQIRRTISYPGILIHLSPEKFAPVCSFFPQNLCRFQILFILKENGSTLSHGIILRLMKTVTSKISDCSQCFPLIISIHPLGCILNHFQVIFPGNRHNLIHGTGYTGIMYRNDCLCFIRNRCFNLCLINIHRIRPDIYKYTGCTTQYKCIRRRHKCIRGHDHFVSRLDICQICRHLKCMCTGSG